MNQLWDRLQLNEGHGAIYDGNRRYVMMRPDVLMGMLHALPVHERQHVLQAWAQSAYEHGGKSVQDYLKKEGKEALIHTMEEGAAALGWGKWHITSQQNELMLKVENSPFSYGYGHADQSVCAPISGIFKHLAEQILGMPVQVNETDCAAMNGQQCQFVAFGSEKTS